MSVNIANQAFAEKYAIHLPLKHHGEYIVKVQSTTSDEEIDVSKQALQGLATNM